MKAVAIQNPALRTVQTVLMFTYALVPIVAGADKFTNLLTDWDKYLNPAVASMLPFPPHTLMLVVGVIEIVAGILVFVRPRIGGYIVMVWLIGIALNLITSGKYLDVAVRDLVMAVGAFTLARLTEIMHPDDEHGLHAPVGQGALAK